MIEAGGQTDTKVMDMPKMTDREKLADLETRHRKISEDIETARRAVRSRYANLVIDCPIERMTEREWKEALDQLLRVGAPAALGALKPLPPCP